MTTSEGDRRFKQKKTQNFKHVSRITGKLQTKIVKISSYRPNELVVPNRGWSEIQQKNQ